MTMEISQQDALPQMSNDELACWITLLTERTGMSLPDERRSYFITSIGLRMRELGCQSYSEYRQRVVKDGVEGAVEWAALVDRLTVHETRFFRHPHSLKLVSRELLRQFAQPQPGVTQPLNIWSVGCSTGEETYSLAMLVDDLSSELSGMSYPAIVGTDISLPSLATAKKALYSHRQVRRVEASYASRYFEAISDTHYKIAQRIRERICFVQMNIVEPCTIPLPMMNVIYCQNVLIYFDKDMRTKILNQLSAHLAPGGVLVLGVGEAYDWVHPQLMKISEENTLAFRKCD